MKYLITVVFILFATISFSQIPVPAPPNISNNGPGCEGDNFTINISGLAPGGQALQVNGNNEWVNCGNAPSLRPSNQITIEAWVKPTSYGDWDCILSNFWDNGSSESGYGLVFNSGKCMMYIKTTSMGANDWNDNPGVALTLNAWQHVAGTYDGSIVKFYLNGYLVASENKSGNIEWSQTTYGLNIARYNDSNEDNRFGGIIDEVRLWNTALTQTVIQNWMYLELTSAHPNYASNLISHYNFNGNVNSSNGQNNGTQTGGTFVVPDYYTYNWAGPGYTNSTTTESITVNNATASQSGTYTVTATIPAGTTGASNNTTLTIYPEYNTTENVTICQGQTYFAGGSNQSTSGTYTDNLTSSFGCDSIVTTNLTVTPGLSSTNNVSICQGQTYFAGGADRSTSGTYTDNLVSSGGCDSTVTTVLTVNPAITQTQNISICQGQTYFAGGANQSNSGTYTDTYTSSSGCDSIVTTNLTVNTTSSENQAVTICQGQSYFAGGSQQTTSGTYTDVFTNSNGCDSTVVTNLTVVSGFNTTIDTSICLGDSYFAGGSLRFTSGTYVDSLLTSAGCDSIITTVLTVIQPVATIINAAICQGETYYAGGTNQTASGTYTDLYQSSTGCDSVVTINLTVNPIAQTQQSVTICPGETYLAGGAPQSTAGIYIDSLTTSHGCDSIVTTTISILPEYIQTIDVSICQGESYFAGGSAQMHTGTYTDLYQTLNGCDSIIITNLTVNDTLTAFDFGEELLIEVCEGDRILLDPQAGNGSYEWSNGDTSEVFLVTESGTYWVTVSNQCDTFDASVTYQFIDCDVKLWVPNAFTPDDTEVNDVFKAKGVNLTAFDLTVYSRWGSTVFHTQDIDEGWDGKMNGEPAPIGLYSWVIYYSGEGFGSRTLIKSGYLSLVR